MRLVRFSSSSLELGRSDPHSDVFVDDAFLPFVHLVQTDFSSFPDLGLDRFSRPENVSSTISNSSRNGENRNHAISNLQRNGENRGVFGRENRNDFGRVFFSIAN